MTYKTLETESEIIKFKKMLKDSLKPKRAWIDHEEHNTYQDPLNKIDPMKAPPRPQFDNNIDSEGGDDALPNSPADSYFDLINTKEKPIKFSSSEFNTNFSSPKAETDLSTRLRNRQ